MKAKVIIPLIVLVLLIVAYFKLLPEKKLRLVWEARSKRNIRANERITESLFYVVPVVTSDPKYRYRRPEGLYLKNDVAPRTRLDTTNTDVARQPVVASASVRVPVKLKIEFQRSLRPGDEIMLSVNGIVFPRHLPDARPFAVLDTFSVWAKADERAWFTALVEMDGITASDSLFLKNEEDHLVPIILRSAEVPKCGRCKTAVWIKDKTTRRGGYICRSVCPERQAKCDCDMVKTK